VLSSLFSIEREVWLLCTKAQDEILVLETRQMRKDPKDQFRQEVELTGQGRWVQPISRLVRTSRRARLAGLDVPRVESWRAQVTLRVP